MKLFLRAVLFCVLLVLWPAPSPGETEPFRFVWLSDTHIGAPTAEADLRASVRDINSLPGFSFVIISGDITQFGSHQEFLLAKSILDGLRIPCHIVPGNHDCKWSESGATEFSRVWGSDRFVFDFGGYCFVGLHEGPVMKMGDGHFAPQDVRWLEGALADLPKEQPIIFVTHYPLDDSLDNWFVVLNELKKYNTQAILVGHGHHNEKMNFEGVPAAMGRSNLRAIPKPSGYTLVSVSNGVMTIAERDPGRGTMAAWDTIRLQKHNYAAMTNHWPRPSYYVNTNYPGVTTRWKVDTGWTIASSPAIADGRVFEGDASGKMRALSAETGAPEWEFTTGGPIYSTAAVSDDRVVFASTDNNIYAVNASTGKKTWEFDTEKPIVASPSITNKLVYIGSSDGKFRALSLSDGKPAWTFDEVGGFVETRPLIYDGKVIFGAWDQHLYALDAKTGELQWKWMGKSPGDLGVMYSPAAFWPVASGHRLFVVAPDRFMTALNLDSGTEIWRTNKWPVRESIGISEDGSRFYVRTMTNGIILAFDSASPRARELWELDAHFGYDINSAMLVENKGVLYYGTKNGLLLAIDARGGKLLWEHKLGVTVLNTVAPLPAGGDLIVSDIDGKITRIGPGKL